MEGLISYLPKLKPLLSVSALTIFYVGGTLSVKNFAVTGNFAYLALTVLLYAVGTLLHGYLMVQFGLARISIILSVTQIAMTTLFAVLWWGETLTYNQAVALLIAVAATTLVLAESSSSAAE